MRADTAITIYLSSPGDVPDERAAVLEVVRRLRYDPLLRQHGVDLRVHSWDDPDAPIPLLASENPQASVNDLLTRPSDCDVVIAVLWSRLGTPLPGGSAPSGTAWEIEDALGGPAKPDVLVYRKLAPATVALGDPEWSAKAAQFEALRSYLDVLGADLTSRGLGMVQGFGTLAEFRTVVDAHLRHLIARRVRDRAPSPVTTAWDGSRSPYPGLQAFTVADADCFFGRDREVDALADLVGRNPLTTVIGPSGSGKSSLIGAGLLPRLAGGRTTWLAPTYDVARGTWIGPRITPRGADGDPARALASSLRALVDGTTEDTCEHWADQARARGRVLVFVDQFEEVFGPACEPYRDSFVDLLVRLADTGLATVVLSLRADFVGSALQHEGLARHLGAAVFPLGQPDLSAVTEIIRRPAAIAGLRFDRDLPELLLVHARQEPGRLPLLAFALNELYLRRDGDRLTTEAYVDIGGVEGAIGHLAERGFARLPDDVRAEFGQVLRKLVEVDEVGGPVRGRASLSALTADPRREALVDALVTARLLVAGTGHDEDPVVELAHEAIFRGWPRLATWIDSAHEDMLALHRMRRAAAEWQRSGRDPLYRWPQERIDPITAALHRLDADLTDVEREFLVPETTRLLDELAVTGTSHERRRQISVRLAVLGDPRPGTGVGPDGFPDVVWCPVPGDPPLWIAKYPVTVAQLDAFRRGHLKATAEYRTGLEDLRPNAPATCSWGEAVSFGQWLRGTSGHVVRLPTEREWERAAGGRATTYPWGDDWRDDHANSATSGLGEPLAVGAYPLGRTPSGALDMVGGVWEWCEDEPTDLDPANGLHVLKGGSARENPDRCRIDVRRLMRGDVVRPDRGFRLCLGEDLFDGGSG